MKILEQTSTHLTFKDTTLEICIFRLGGAIFLLFGVLGFVLSIFLNIISNGMDAGMLFMTLAMAIPIITGTFLLLYFPKKTICFNKNLNKLTLKSEALLRKRNDEYAISDIRKVALEIEGVGKDKVDLFNRNLNEFILKSEALSRELERESTINDSKKRILNVDELLKNQSYSIVLTIDSQNQSLRLFSLKSHDAKQVASLICRFLNITQ